MGSHVHIKSFWNMTCRWGSISSEKGEPLLCISALNAETKKHVFKQFKQCMYMTWLKKKWVSPFPAGPGNDLTQAAAAQHCPRLHQADWGGWENPSANASWVSATLCACGFKTFYPTAHRQSDSVHTSLLLCTSALVHPEAVCWALCCTPSTPLIASPHILQTQ